MKAYIRLLLLGLVVCAACVGCDHKAPLMPHQAPDASSTAATSRTCETFTPAAADGLSLEAAREAHFWNGLGEKWAHEERRQPGYTQARTRSLLEESRTQDGLCFGDAYIAGRLLFAHAYTPAEGLGNGLSEAKQKGVIRRVHKGRFGGPDADRCTSCHWRGGNAGAGALVDNAFFLGDGVSIASADAHNPPSLHGAGVLELLAAEMTEELHERRRVALAQAKTSGQKKGVKLVAKGVSFGRLEARPDGTVDLTGVNGVEADLVVRPFGWKGTHSTLRGIVEESFQIHLGVQGPGIVSDKALAGDGPANDRDKDGVQEALTDDQLTAVVIYLAAQGIPVMRPHERLNEAEAAAPGLLAPRSTVFLEEWVQGRALFESVGCATCHVPSLKLNRAVFNTQDTSGQHHSLDLAAAMERPRVTWDEETSTYPVFLFSDLKRHDMGEGLASQHEHQGVARRMFRTPPLWGLADSGPWMHDGRAPSLDQAIRFHDGEARLVKERYKALQPHEQGALRLFLTWLRRDMRWKTP